MPDRPANIIGLNIADALGDQAFEAIRENLDLAYTGLPSVFEFTYTPNFRRIRVAFTPDGADGVYILSMDVTEETQTRVALQQTRRPEMAAQLTNGLAHDFSNLLTIILGMQSKLARMRLGADAEDLINATQSAARRGGRLLNRIADMTSRRSLRPQATNLHALLDELRLLASPSLPRTIGLSVLDHLPDDTLLLDPDLLQDALLNLILNARDAMGANGQITVTAHSIERTWVEIAVTDTGPGFSPEALEKAINPFFTTKGGEGSGLGLPMVYDMTKLAGGDLRLGNTRSGAIVTLRLPFRSAPAASSGLTLLVEDSEPLRAATRDMLMDLGHTVVEATSVDEATALLADIPDITLILSDIRLEGNATGLDLLDRSAGADIPAILMTSLPVDDPLHTSALARAPVLQKPFSTARLSALIRNGPQT